MKFWKLALAATTALSVAQPALAQTASPTGPWDPQGALAGTATGPASHAPNWSTARRTGTGCNTGPVTQLADPYAGYFGDTIRGFHGLIAGDQPLVARNFGPPVNGNNITVLPGALIMHPGPENECAMLRLTVPAGGSGIYAVSANFQASDSNVEDGVTGMVLRNGVQVGTTVNTSRAHEPINGQVSLCPGDTLDFAVHMNRRYEYDTTRLTGNVNRVANLPIASCVTTGVVGPGVNLGTGLVTPLGDPIDMTGTPNRPRSTCCAPWSGVDILPALVPTFPTDATGPYTMSFTPSAALNAQMSAYLNYLHAMNPGVTTLTMSWQAANLGTGATAATSGTMIGGAQNVTWQWTNSGVTMNGGGFWTGAPFPIGSWIGFQTSVSVNGGQAGASLLGPDCRVNWSAWRAQAQQIVQGGSNAGSSRIVFESINARGQVQRTRPIDVRPGVAIETGQLLIRDRPN